MIQFSKQYKYFFGRNTHVNLIYRPVIFQHRVKLTRGGCHVHSKASRPQTLAFLCTQGTMYVVPHSRAARLVRIVGVSTRKMRPVC